MLELLLDLANILGGFLLAIGLLVKIPAIGDNLATASDTMAPFGWVIGIVALVTGGFFLIVHLTTGPHLLHYEVVAIITGVLLLSDRVRAGQRKADPSSVGADGFSIFLAVFGVIAILVGLQGLVTPN